MWAGGTGGVSGAARGASTAAQQRRPLAQLCKIKAKEHARQPPAHPLDRAIPLRERLRPLVPLSGVSRAPHKD